LFCQYYIKYSNKKNLLLLKSRNVCFEDIIHAIENNRVIIDINHPNKKKYPGQKIVVVKIKNYAYAAPYYIDAKEKTVKFITIFPSRKLTKKYLPKGGRK